MRVFVLGVVAIALLIVGQVSGARAGSDGIIKKMSPYSVQETLDRLEGIMKKKGITIFARVNHAGGAKKIGKPIPDEELLIFGNPKIGTPLIQSNPMAGIDLPLKVLAYKDSAGKVWLAYSDPALLAKRHGIKNQAALIKKMGGILNGLTGGAIKK